MGKVSSPGVNSRESNLHDAKIWKNGKSGLKSNVGFYQKKTFFMNTGFVGTSFSSLEAWCFFSYSFKLYEFLPMLFILELALAMLKFLFKVLSNGILFKLELNLNYVRLFYIYLKPFPMALGYHAALS